MFKLINFIEDETFNQLRYQMKAELSNNFSPNSQLTLLDEEVFFQLSQEGIRIDINELTFEKDRTLSYQGIRVLIYIRDVSCYGFNPTMPKFHIAHCSKLEDMVKNGRKGRYVAATKDDGDFDINIIKRKIATKKTEKLLVCRLCLDALSWNGFSLSDSHSQKKKIINNFCIANFFEKYPKSLHSLKPSHTTDTQPLNVYSSDWDKTSKAIREKRNNTCESCGRFYINGRGLHVHHISGCKYNDDERNLRVLCEPCHAAQPYHSHMKRRLQ